MNRLAIVLTLAFFLFILWIIYMADTGQSSIFFDLVKAIPYGDKVGHIFLFGFLTLGLNTATRFKTVGIRRARLFVGTTLVSLFVVAEELSQQFFSSRSFDLNDLLADAIGIITFSLISLLLKPRVSAAI